MRATTSTPEPAGKPISTVTGLAGQSSARAVVIVATDRISAAREPTRAFNMVTPEERAVRLLCWGNDGRIAMGYMTGARILSDHLLGKAKAF